MLDEMAIQLNQEKSNHKEALSDLKLQHEKEVRHTHTFAPLLTLDFVVIVLYCSSVHFFHHISSSLHKKVHQHRINFIIKSFL